MTNPTTGITTANAQQPAELTNITWLAELPSAAPWLSDPLIVAFAGELRAHPNLWAPWPKQERDLHLRGASVRKGNTVFPKGDFEAATRAGVLYVRYVGPVPN